MVPLAQLCLPIVVSAVAVFFVSAITHMALKYHNAEYRKLPNEDEVLDAIGRGKAAPGMYMLPYCAGMKDMQDPAIMRRLTEGPVGLLFLRKPAAPALGPYLGKWFLNTLVVSLLAGYVAASTLAPGTPYLQVFRVVGVVAALGYAGAHAQMAIWKSEPASAALKDTVDGVIYGLVTAGVFGWLWPQ
jgi:hypothetical protein